MQADRNQLFELERRFWQALVDEDTDSALQMLCEPSFMVSPNGSMKFDHATYRRMAEHGDMVVKSYQLSDLEATFPSDDTAIVTYRVRQVIAPRGPGPETEQHMADTSTWVRDRGGWKCAMHTEAPSHG